MTSGFVMILKLNRITLTNHMHSTKHKQESGKVYPKSKRGIG